MIIRHMQGTFGTLDGEQLRLDTGLNIIYAPNESGKSTWCAFLRAMLYGIDTSQRARAGFVPDKQKYAPWSGKPMAGELELEQGGKYITIRRWTEAPNAPLRGFSAVYTGTDIPVPGLTAADAGEQLTGVSAEVFARTAFIGQGGLVVTGTPELEKRISAIVTSGEEASSYTEADAQLRAWLRRRRSGQHGALPELEGRISTVEEQLHRLERNAQEQAACAAELQQTDAELQTVTEQMNAARQRQRRAALSSMGEEKSNLRTLEQALEQARRDAAAKRTALEQTHFGVQTPDEAGETAERDAQRAEALAGTAEHGGKPYFWIAALVLAALCAVLGYLVAQPLYYAAIALAVLTVVLLVVARSGKKRAQEASAALGKLLRSYGAQDADGIYYQAEVHRAAYRTCAAAMQTEQEAAAALEDAREHQCETHERLLQSLDLRAARARPSRSTSASARSRACARACARSRRSLRGRRWPSATRWRSAASTRSCSSSATRSSGSTRPSPSRSRRSAGLTRSCRAAFRRSWRKRRRIIWTTSPMGATTSSCSRATCRPRRAAPTTRRRATRPISRPGRRTCCICPCVWRCAS
ncbi:MAG: AAA family ATPase [Oscillospiraceae bacterium]